MTQQMEEALTMALRNVYFLFI